MYSARLYHSFVDSAEMLCGFPEMGAVERLLMHCPENFRSLLVRKKYKLIYTVEKPILSFMRYGIVAVILIGWFMIRFDEGSCVCR